MVGSLVFVSGASSGIGAALARAVPYPDARLIDVSRRGGRGCEHFEADLSEPAGWRAVAGLFAREIAGFEGERVVFFHAAGTLQPIGFAGEVDPEAYARGVLLNAASLPVLGDAFLRAARATAAACTLVSLGSGAARTVYEGWSSYGAGKAASDQWIRIAGAEQARRGGRCRLLSVAPGVVETAMQEEIRATSPRAFPDVTKFVRLHRSGALREPDAVAREVWALLDAGLENGAVVDLRDFSKQPE